MDFSGYQNSEETNNGLENPKHVKSILRRSFEKSKQSKDGSSDNKKRKIKQGNGR